LRLEEVAEEWDGWEADCAVTRWQINNATVEVRRRIIRVGTIRLLPIGQMEIQK